jgi:hypothetical protein
VFSTSKFSSAEPQGVLLAPFHDALGSTDALLNIMGRFDIDNLGTVDDAHVKTHRSRPTKVNQSRATGMPPWLSYTCRCCASKAAS